MHDYDVIVIGSGFGGSVAALRLTEKGYRVAVLEAGKRFVEDPADAHDANTDALPATSWDLRSFLWAPALGCFGIQRIHRLDNVLVLAGAGVGGGSLNYANTLYEPLPAFFDDPQWAGITDWRTELAPYYAQASRMLGVVTYNRATPADEAMRAVADQMGVGGTFRQAPVGVFLGGPKAPPGGIVPDPYFGGAGPARAACLHCGECMTGCRHNAKNTLVKNYLYLAERAGARVLPMTTAIEVRPAPSGYTVRVRRTGGSTVRHLTSAQVVIAAGTFGSQLLLHRMKDEGVLPRLSDRLGVLTRTNSEAIIGAKARGRSVDYSSGVAITSSFHPDPQTHIEPVRYGHGSNAMGLLQTVLTDGGGGSRLLAALRQMARDPAAALRIANVRHWSERTVIALVMQSLDNSITVRGERGPFGRYRLRSSQGHGEPSPDWIPAGNRAVRLLAEQVGGDSGGSWGDVFHRPLTAHFLGGAVIGADPDRGVIDAYHRVFGHPGLHIVDGSAVSANLGVNPSLTITAQAERAMALWPNKGELDSRPEIGEEYRSVAPVRPRLAVVPAGAPGELRLR